MNFRFLLFVSLIFSAWASVSTAAVHPAVVTPSFVGALYQRTKASVASAAAAVMNKLIPTTTTTTSPPGFVRRCINGVCYGFGLLAKVADMLPGDGAEDKLYMGLRFAEAAQGGRSAPGKAARVLGVYRETLSSGRPRGNTYK